MLALFNTVFAQEETQDAAILQWRSVADQLCTKFPKLAALMDKAEHDVLVRNIERYAVAGTGPVASNNSNDSFQSVRARSMSCIPLY